MVIEIRKGKIVELDKEYVIVGFATNADNNSLYVILQDINGLLTTISLSKLENLLLEQEKKKNAKEQKPKLEPIDKIDR